MLFFAVQNELIKRLDVEGKASACCANKKRLGNKNLSNLKYCFVSTQEFSKLLRLNDFSVFVLVQQTAHKIISLFLFTYNTIYNTI